MLATFAGLIAAPLAPAAPTVFAPKAGIYASVEPKGPSVEFELRRGKEVRTGTLAVETERELRIEVADYNFDGYRDFATRHIDDGMGTIDVYNLFIYSPTTDRFVELMPKCGDMFLAIRVNRRAKTITNTYYQHGQITTCTRKYRTQR
ncbi:MAG: XAC2610-related protein [Gammaproteobacteria bacterium]